MTIIYLFRNKTYFSIDKVKEKYIINRSKLNSKNLMKIPKDTLEIVIYMIIEQFTF